MTNSERVKTLPAKELDHFLSIEMFYKLTNIGNTDKSTSKQQFPVFSAELSRMRRSVELLSRETMRIDFKTASLLAVYMFEWFSTNFDIFLHPYFAMRKLKYSMQDRQKPFSEFQQTAAIETCDKFRCKSFLKRCLYSIWFTFIEFVFKLVVACSFLSCSRHQKHTGGALWIQVTGSAF